MADATARLRFALLGCGNMMAQHARLLRDHPGAEIVALCDVSEEKVKDFFDKHLTGKHLAGVPHRPEFFVDAGAMYAETRPDAVVISTPHTQHYAQGAAALDAGCHVFMEKPMVTTLEHACLLEEKVRKAGKVFVIGYNTPCSAEFAYLRGLIRAGTLGPLEVVTGFISQDWLRYPLLWRRDPALSGGGQACDSGAHLFNSLCWSVESEVEEVFAFVDNHGAEVDINSVA
jgi:predicted dehydrogenase